MDEWKTTVRGTQLNRAPLCLSGKPCLFSFFFLLCTVELNFSRSSHAVLVIFLNLCHSSLFLVYSYYYGPIPAQ